MVKVFNSAQEATQTIPSGQMKLLIINGTKVALANMRDGFKAFDSACPHQKNPLHKGLLTRYQEIVCPLHHYRFNLQTGEESANRCGSLKFYSLVINENGFFIQI